MTTPPSLPSLGGLSWSRHKKPSFDTRVASHVSGREVRVALMSYPLYEFEAVYDGLSSSATAAYAGLGASSLQSLMGFFLQLQGQFGTFLYIDPEDNSTTGQSIGTGDGETCAFVLTRSFGGFTEPASYVTALDNVYFNGIIIPAAAYSLVTPNYLVFNFPPPVGIAITADLTFAFNCRFLDDQMDFEEFMSQLWKLDGMKFRSVKAPSAITGTPPWLPTPSANVPILYADFVNGNYWYNGATYASFASWVSAQGGSFTRAAAALYTNASGVLASAPSNTPRFDYDPVSGAALGLLLEPPFENFFLYSQLFSNAAWTQTNVSVSTSGTAPDGTSTAQLLTESGSGSQAHEISQAIGSPVTPEGTVTIYARAGTATYLNIAASTATSGEWGQAIFDLSQGGVTEITTGSYTSTAAINVPQTTIEPAPEFGDGWYRCCFQAHFESSPSSVTFRFGTAAAAHNNTYNSVNGQELHASVGNTIYLWGLQFYNSPAVPLSYVSTTSLPLSGGSDLFYLGVNWDSAANSLTYLQETDMRTLISAGGSVAIANGYYGSNEDSWSLQISPAAGVQEPSGNTASSPTNNLPGISTDVLRVDSTTITLSDNGNSVVTSSVGTARAAMTKLSPGGYEGSISLPVRIRKMSAWATGLANSELQGLSTTLGTPVTSIASTIHGNDSNWCGYPGLCLLPSGYLCVTYVRFNSSAQGSKPSQIWYTTAPNVAGPWSTPAVAVSNSSSSQGPQGCWLTATGTGPLATVYWLNFASPYTSGLGTLQIVTATETSPGVLSWGTPTTIDPSPFFTGADPAGNQAGDFTASAPILLPSGKWMQLIYGYLPGANTGGLAGSTSTAAVFSSSPTTAASWGSFTIIANGSSYANPLAFSEAGAFLDGSNNIVVALREDNPVAQDYGNPGYWRTVCRAGADPTNAANWGAPTFMHQADFGEAGKPDAISLGGNGMWMMTRGSLSGGSGYPETDIAAVAQWNAGAGPFPDLPMVQNSALHNRNMWYSQSQLLNAFTIGSALGVDSTGGVGPEVIYMLTSQFFGQGLSQ